MDIWKPKEQDYIHICSVAPLFLCAWSLRFPRSSMKHLLQADCAVRAREAKGALGILLLKNFFSWSGWKNEDTLQHPWSKLWEAHSWGNFSLGEMTMACSASVQAHSSMLHWPCREMDGTHSSLRAATRSWAHWNCPLNHGAVLCTSMLLADTKAARYAGKNTALFLSDII